MNLATITTPASASPRRFLLLEALADVSIQSPSGVSTSGFGLGLMAVVTGFRLGWAFLRHGIVAHCGTSSRASAFIRGRILLPKSVVTASWCDTPFTCRTGYAVTISLLPARGRSRVPLALDRHYPASSVLRASPPSHTARSESLAGFRLEVTHLHRRDFPCCVVVLRGGRALRLRTCRRHYLGGTVGAVSLDRFCVPALPTGGDSRPCRN